MTPEEARKAFDEAPDVEEARKAFEAAPDEPRPMPQPSEPAALSPESVSGTALRSFGRGASMGFTPALAGVSGALQELGSRGPVGRAVALGAPAALGPLGGPMALAQAASAPELVAGSSEQLGDYRNLPVMEAMLQRFRADRDRARMEQERGARANPVTAMASEVGGAMAMPGPKGATLGKRMAGYGAQGALMGTGTATSREGGNWTDVVQGAASGLIGGGMGEGLMAAARPLIRKGAGIVGDIVQGRATKDVGDVASEVAKLEGQYGAAAQALNRTNENLTRQVAGLPSASGSLLPAQTQQKARRTLTDPDTIQALTEIAERDVANLPGKAADYRRLQAASQQARANAPQEAAKRTQDYFNDGLWRSEVWPRLGALAQRGGVATLAGGLSGALGAGGALATGQDPLKVGMMTGAAGFGSVMGGQGLLTMGRNLAKSPRVQRAAVEGGLSAIGQAGEFATRMGTGGAAIRDAASVADPMGPLRQYLGLSREERNEANTQAFEDSP